MENNVSNINELHDSIISKFTVYITISFAGILLYYCGLVNMYVWIILCLTYLTTCNRIEAGVLLLIFGSSLFGRMFASQYLYLSTIVISLLIGIFLIHKEIIRTIDSNLRPYIFIVILLGVFTIYFLLGPSTSYANEKILKLIVRSLIWITVFLIFSQSERISSKTLSVAFLLLSLFYISQSYQLYGIRPTSIFDFSFFRNFCDIIGRNENKTLVVNYQTLGYLSLASSVFWLIDRKFWNNDKKNSCLLLLISFWLITISGTRQTLLAFGIIFILRILMERGNILSISNIVIGVSFVLIFMLIINFIGSQYFDQVFSSDSNADTRLHRDTKTPFRVMEISPFWGVGFGAYPIYANKDYPHNFFLEILCELGVVGIILITIIIVLFILSSKNKNFVRFLSVNDSYMFLLILLFFLRGQISGDLSDSISFICILFSCNYAMEKEYDAIG